ncbi:response regulator transcription factor [Nocardioides sp.]|uniref:response regulator transcription factor n=1 Tax=Nocardioides sp. TaxID=35761 RepID=UPI000C948A8F|nr:response regulator transcription factor [Nocardioides sp.]MAS55965.1 DNA-binding response regulator [Pimelobacter sp.]MDE0775827.1 response regulator transcription factor [Nocardioides sp.]
MRVLLVEDERTLARTIARGLQAEGMLTDVAHDGLVGLERALDGDYDVVVLDIMLPGRNGYDVCRSMRAAEAWAPVLMLTAKDGEYDEVDAFDLGADDYLTKPFSFPVLVARLRALVRRGGIARPTVLRAGDLALDPATREVSRGDEQIDLTAREFAVLHHLMRHRGMVVSKLDLLQAVWDLHHEGSENVVEVYVGYLRRKVDVPFGRQSIQTVRGSGYRLVGDGR